ncbi:aldehyde-activating protein [Sorangium cellulosum]|uniref:Aldehyde-activating protein n=1 Tax=Sorangium cellulosum TaxID=56 RepID=A0A150T0T1_SORCE|nr:aldehyde-activating protein [Sorangium cellulosum]KYF98325.1 aldehyde-activating protein [Sorangium cellulosum]
MRNRLASCSCGKLSAEVEGEPIRVSVCHCLACQRRTGSVFGAQARFSRENVKIKGHGKDFVRIGDEGTKSTFTFCPECGATVYYAMAGHEDVIAIPVGAFADPAFPGPASSVYEERMHGWVVMPRDIEHMR